MTELQWFFVLFPFFAYPKTQKASYYIPQGLQGFLGCSYIYFLCLFTIIIIKN